MFSDSRFGSILRPTRRQESGFTLVELVVAVGMLGVALVAMSVMFTLSFATARDAQNRLEAKAEAQRILERLRTLPYFISYADQVVVGSDPDILDRFFVNSTDVAPGVVRTIDGISTTGYYTGNSTGTCSKTATPVECAYISTFATTTPPRGRATLNLRFVREPTEDGSTITDTQIVAAPIDFDSNIAGRDTPPSKLALATIQIDWTEAGRPLSYTVDSIIYGTRTIPQKSSGLATAGGGKVTGPKFQDGAIFSDIIATLGLTSANTTESDINLAVAKGTIIEVRQLDPLSGIELGPLSFLLRPSGTASDSRTTAGSTVPPNSVVFNSPGQVLFTIDGTGALIGGIGSGAATAQTTLLPPLHPGVGQPEAIATQTVTDLKLYYRPPAGLSVEGMSVASISSSSKVESSSTQIKSTATTTLTNVRIWGTHDYDYVSGYVGVVKIESLTITAITSSDGLIANSSLTWTWNNLRIWNPATLAYQKLDGTPEGGSSSCAYTATQSTTPLPSCASNISIPAPYGVPGPGETFENCSTCSLAIVVGNPHVAASPDGQLAQASQRGLLTFYFKNQGLRPLETTIFTLGTATSEVTYRQHGH